ncbi:hypothetical protein NE237_019959 [Protea cynaroides]|uniref:Uncharacterized protein n=1 Tax=Protea cynaroides TaxID=273540 RepID=A0A9Q0K173_9MAGN|nr:hypothetical protein NE237_019959 [Protea cynaroides]
MRKIASWGFMIIVSMWRLELAIINSLRNGTQYLGFSPSFQRQHPTAIIMSSSHLHLLSSSTHPRDDSPSLLPLLSSTIKDIAAGNNNKTRVTEDLKMKKKKPSLPLSVSVSSV